jgi:hypothetical protein
LPYAVEQRERACAALIAVRYSEFIRGFANSVTVIGVGRSKGFLFSSVAVKGKYNADAKLWALG